MKLAPYPEYKDSGAVSSWEPNIPWLKVLPRNWTLVRSKRIFTTRKEKARPDDEQLSATQAYGVILQREFERKVKRKVVRINLHLDKRAHVEPDDFVISMRSFQGGLERAWVRGCIRSSYVVLKPSSQTHVGYFSYLFKSRDYISALQATSNFIRDGQDLNFNNFRLVDLPLPPLEEQEHIGRFLDWQTTKINTFIRNKRRLIELLKEQKQNVINQAVTRGLDPNVKLKPSGVEWIGDIPEHWEVSRLKNELHCLNNQRIPLSATERGAMKKRSYDYYGASGIIDKVDDYIYDDELLLIAEDGANLVLRNLPLAIIAKGKFWVNNHAHILKPKSGNIGFLAYLLEKIDYLPWVSGAAQPKLTKDRLIAISIAVPSRNEQDEIVEFIKDATATIDYTISRATHEIDLIREYRARLISDVVTGQVDVRHIAVPEIAGEDLTPLDEDDTDAEDLLDEALETEDAA
jgi:type I restriction enzyme S subunit